MGRLPKFRATGNFHAPDSAEKLKVLQCRQVQLSKELLTGLSTIKTKPIADWEMDHH
jgi:hypothetical protein